MENLIPFEFIKEMFPTDGGGTAQVSYSWRCQGQGKNSMATTAPPNPNFLSRSHPSASDTAQPPPPTSLSSSVPETLGSHFPEVPRSTRIGDESEYLSFSDLSTSSSSAFPDISASSDHPQHSIPTLLHLSFNQDHACFAAGTDHGFRIYNCDPFREIFRRDFATESGAGAGIGSVEMLFRCNILALVGGGPQPQYPTNKVMIWDDHQNRCIGELSFRSEVKAVRLRRDKIVVVLLQKIFVYNFSDLKMLHQIDTVANPKGLCEISQVSGSLVLVCPGVQKGQVRVEHYGSKRTKFITAHDSRIACLALTQDGRLLATSSSKGTLVRVFNTLDGSLLQEVRRGAHRAEIHSLAFSSTAQWLAVTSDKGTVHVFGLGVDSGSLANERPRTPETNPSSPSALSSLSFIKGVLPKYFSSEWSVAQFRLQEGCRYIVAFGHQKNTIVVVGMDGSFIRCEFDPVNGGEMTQIECHNFLKPEEAL